MLIPVEHLDVISLTFRMVPWVGPMVWMYLFGAERRHHDLIKSKYDALEMSSSGKNYTPPKTNMDGT